MAGIAWARSASNSPERPQIQAPGSQQKDAIIGPSVEAEQEKGLAEACWAQELPQLQQR